MLFVMTEEQIRQLQVEGYLILRDVIDEAWLEALRASAARQLELEGENAGAEFRKEQNADRLANLVDKGHVFQQVIVHSNSWRLPVPCWDPTSSLAA